jgi:hypothetical protein
MFLELKSYSSMRLFKRIVYCLSAMVPACILQSHSAVLPPDSSIIFRHKLLLYCKDYQLNAERISSWKNEDSIITLNVSGKDVSGFSKYLLETSEGEKYVIRLSNGTAIYVNSVSSIEFNPQAPNFFDIKRGEAYFEVKQNSKIYISAKLYVWALAGAVMNVAYNDIHPFENTDERPGKGDNGKEGTNVGHRENVFLYQ